MLSRLDIARDASGAIYGTLITASTMVGAAEGVHDLWEIAATVLVTLTVYTVAHAYAEVLGAPDGRVPSWAAVVHELAVESTMLTACVLPLAVMVGASLLGASLDEAVTAGACSAVAMLFVWGPVAARKVHAGAITQLVSAVAFGLLGLAIVALKVTTSH